MKLLAISIVLIGCGPNQYKIPQDTSTSGTESTNGSGGNGNGSTVGESHSSTAPTGSSVKDPIPALAFTSNVKIDGVKRIYSATKLDRSLYFSGEDLQGNRVLGQIGPNGGDTVLSPFGQINANNIFLKGDLFLLGNTSGSLYVGNYHSVIQIEPRAMQAVGQMTSECSMGAPLTYLKDDRWNLIWNSTLTVCGSVDGTTIQKNKPILNLDSGEPLPYDSSAAYAVSENYIHEYSRSHLTLNMISYIQGYRINLKYSLGGYLYKGPESVEVPGDDDKTMWFFGCNQQQDCYLSRAEVTQQ